LYQLTGTEIEQVATRILKHLYDNPQKRDSLKGICDWWLLEEKINYTINLLTTAIEYLLSKKLIIEKKIIGSGKVYQINSLRKNDIFKVLNLNMDYLNEIQN